MKEGGTPAGDLYAMCGKRLGCNAGRPVSVNMSYTVKHVVSYWQVATHEQQELWRMKNKPNGN